MDGSAALRRCVLAAAVMHDLDVTPVPDGVEVITPGSGTGVVLSWPVIELAVGDCDLESAVAWARLARWLSTVTTLASSSPADLAQRARPVALPVGHALHPGRGWVRERVLGGVLDVGLGYVGLHADPDAVDVVPESTLELLGHRPALWWRQAQSYLEQMGAIAATRFAREPDVPLRPMGDCDVVTLLASRSFRAALCIQQPMRAAAVPMRTRGWLDPSRVDPAFAVTAAQLTGPEDRGFERPILITADEVVLSVDFGHDRVVRQVLRDTCAPDPVLPNVRYR